jgi:nitroimidazol reductase NimA-like FMN-containing flavoprotein (pyridoxamine 5'-phosphate oxidase superfamily)
MPQTQPREILGELLASQRFGVLATQEGGQPHLSLMAFAATADLRDLIFATRRPTRKYANLTADPRAALLVDNRTNQARDLEDALAATAVGRAEEVGAAEKERLREIFLAKHPQLKSFLAAADCALMRLRVTSYHMVSRFQEVQVWPMT